MWKRRNHSCPWSRLSGPCNQVLYLSISHTGPVQTLDLTWIPAYVLPCVDCSCAVWIYIFLSFFSFFLHPLPFLSSPQSTCQTSFTFLISLPRLLSVPSNVLSAAGISPSYYRCYVTHPSSAPVPTLISIAGHSHSGSLLARDTKPQINQ